MLPATIPRAVTTSAESAGLRPELEFVFRTLVDLRVDMDDLRREFEAYRAGEGVVVADDAYLGHVRSGVGRGIEIPAYSPNEPEEESVAEAVESDEGVVVFRPGMTIEELERGAIEAALREEIGRAHV